ncbi:hypothetical protein H6G76_21030 [Nostoc sp. FACHB-152]|uniref:hypothetical protein n=1 Tax=unclassified Nostoc TaxID=2593658 RepID=UPI0016889620|nr:MULTISPECIES: hypothetical protein [unclassified Nostoc]MBD2449606.1 hypothetical protein [Nostoc sp. FACHB-152]MBD2468973.1 hypothetical protein [Nostoc sp. FACHB-145]
MQVKNKQLKKWILHPVLITLVTVGAIACQSTVSSSPTNQAIATEVNSLEKSTSKPVAQNQGTYRSDRYHFRFSYSPKDFIIDNQISTPRNNIDAPLAAIDIWTKQHAQKIRAGAYEGGTEYPANVQVAVYNNPRKLSLQKWIQQSNQFTVSRDFKPGRIAGQTGLKFQSSGLYEHENVAFISPKDSRIIVVSLAKNGSNNDAIYRKVYQQVVNSFAFLNK